MLNTLLGSKQNMSQAFVQDTRVPVTWVKAGPCIVTHIKRQDKDGYWAVQLGFGQKKIKNISKQLQGHLKGAINESKLAPRFLREVKLDKEPEFRVGDIINAKDIFKKGDIVSIAGTSKGKGFAGVVKRWGFAGGPKTHGQSDRLRAPGSIGQGTTPGRVYKGKKMAGRMGGVRISIKNLMVVEVKPDQALLAVSGPVPGAAGSLLSIKKIAEGNLEELVEEAPKPEIQQVEAGESVDTKDEANESGGVSQEEAEK